ncbi:MAG: hypothetical protein H6Q22_1595 [Bacteroidetes bacterium]|nr:hypothetical protein [Bacteroidota bacterium]
MSKRKNASIGTKLSQWIKNVAIVIKMISAVRMNAEPKRSELSPPNVSPASHKGTYLRIANIAQMISPVFMIS